MANYKQLPLAELLEMEERWEGAEDDEEEQDFRQNWVKNGIEIYEALVTKRVNDEEKARFYYNLASLYLEYGRSEKMIGGDLRQAFRHLQKAARLLPDKGDTFYHLAFLAENMDSVREKWESAGFYAKEALERGVNTEKKIKIWCLLGKSYQELGFQKDAARCFAHSVKLDPDDVYAYFRRRYSNPSTEKASFARLTHGGERTYLTEQDQWISKSKNGGCFVLVIDRRGNTLYGNGASVNLDSKNTEIMRLLFEWNEGLTKFDIQNNTTLNIAEKSVKTYINRLRVAIKQLGIDGNNLIQITGTNPNKKYTWNPKIEKHLIEK